MKIDLDNLPDGWVFVPGKKAEHCEHCGHDHPEVLPKLRDASGREQSLIGNRGMKQIREMVAAVIETHPRGWFGEVDPRAAK